MARFPESWMQDLMTRTDIVDLVGEYLTLKPSGGRHWGLCPFHGEKTASFSVSQDKQLYYCFGCHAGGTAVQFVMSIEKLPFQDAIELLARRVNLPMPETIDDKALQQANEKQKRVYLANREAAYFYHSILTQSAKAPQSYLENRGISAATARIFGLGYAPDAWDKLTAHLINKGFSEEELLYAGLARRKQNRIFDYFRNRLIFPIVIPGKQKQVIGFGGRILDQGEPKYLNTAETKVFNKRRQLYGANLLPSSLESIVLVEGYMDVISLYQGGVNNVVATLGTALTQQQARLIKRYTSRVFVAYDGDSAGQNAALRGLDILKQEGLEVRVVEFPQSMDPDDFIRQHGKAAFETLCEKAWSLIDFKLRRMASQYDLQTDDGREGFAREGSAFIARLSPLEQERYYPMLSRASGFSTHTLRQEGALLTDQNQENKGKMGLGKNRVINNRNTKGIPTLPITETRLAAERDLIQLAAHNSQLRQAVLPNKNLLHLEAHRRFLEAMEHAGENPSITALLNDMEEQDASLISAALSRPDPPETEQLLQISLRKLMSLDLIDQKSALQQEAEDDATPSQRRLECVSEIRRINAELDTLESTDKGI